MKALRIVGIVLLSIVMVIFICLFSASFGFKDVAKSFATEAMSFTSLSESSSFTNGLGDINEEQKNPKVKEIIEDEEVQSFIDKYIDITLEGFSGKDMKDVDFSKDLIELIESKKDELNEAGIKITDEDIETFKNSDEYNELNEGYNQMFTDITSDVSNEGLQFIKAFAFLGTNTFRIICLVIIFISVLLIGLLSWSPFKWLLPVGIDCIVGSGLTLSGGIIIKSMISAAVEISSTKLMGLFLPGFVLLILGIIMLIIYAIFKSKEKVSEVSEVSK